LLINNTLYYVDILFCNNKFDFKFKVKNNLKIKLKAYNCLQVSLSINNVINSSISVTLEQIICYILKQGNFL
jgi:hypothetical protein